jgi:prevent-host-death family protein
MAKSISMLELRTQAEEVLNRVQRGERLVLTYRGRPVARLEPVETDAYPPDDPFLSITDLAESGSGPLSNADIDRIVYGQ